MATPDPLLVAGTIPSNALVTLTRGTAVLDPGRRVAFSYGVSITSLPQDERITAFGPSDRAELVDGPASIWQRDDLVTILAFDGHPTPPEVTTYLVTAVRRFPGPLPLVVCSLAGTIATAPA